MKLHIALASFGLICVSNASFTLEYEFKIALDASGAQVPSGSLWALVVDNGDNIFADFGLDDSLFSQPAGTADNYFTSSVTSISLGASVGGGTVFAMGGFGGAGTASGTLPSLTMGTNGLAAGQEYAIYWFPDVEFTGPGSYFVGSEVGGLQSTSQGVGDFLDVSMVIPTDGFSYTTGAYSISSGDGEMPNNHFQAVALIPEPSSALLGAFGALALLRRRRVVQG